MIQRHNAEDDRESDRLADSFFTPCSQAPLTQMLGGRSPLLPDFTGAAAPRAPPLPTPVGSVQYVIPQNVHSQYVNSQNVKSQKLMSM